jgi:hypothetical protein
MAQQPLGHRAFDGLAIHVLPTQSRWTGEHELALYIRGERRYMGHRAQWQLLFALLEQPSCVYSFAHLCGALGLKNRSALRDKQTLFEHVRRSRMLLDESKLPLHIALVPKVGYALCRKARRTQI